MRLWRRLTSCKTRSRFILLSFWYTLLALSAYTLYALKDRSVTSDDVSSGAKAWQRSRFYRALFGQTYETPDVAAVQNYVADDTALEKNLIAVDALVAASGGAWAKPEINAVTGDEERGALHQQSILRGSGAQGIVGQSGKTGVDVNDNEQRTFDLEEGEEQVDSEEEEYVVVGDPHILEYKNRTSDNDAHIPVTSTIDVTSIHFVNSTVKPTPPPEVEGYFNIQTNEKLRLRCSQCALVSSSGHLVNSSAGTEIDSYPCVLRMNSAPVTGYEKDVGSKTTIRIVGHVNLKVLNTSNELQTEILRNTSTRAEKIIVPWLYNIKVNAESNMYYKAAKNLSKLYPEVDFFLLTPDKMKIAESLFQTETGLSRQEARTWLSTGWMSMLFAVDVCDKVDIFGLVPENFCSKHPNASTLYHYYEQDGLKECEYYKASEEKLTSGHKFITEKAVFARWATKFNMEFHLPAWNLTELAHAHNATGAIAETPFLKMFYEAKRTGTLPKAPTGSRVVRRVVKRVVKKVIIRRKIPVVAKAPQT